MLTGLRFASEHVCHPLADQNARGHCGTRRYAWHAPGAKSDMKEKSDAGDNAKRYRAGATRNRGRKHTDRQFDFRAGFPAGLFRDAGGGSHDPR